MYKIDWNDIETVLLDMDGTILDLHYDNFFWQHYLPDYYANLHSLQLDVAREFLKKEILNEVGTLNFYSIDFWDKKFNIDIIELKRNLDHLICFLPYANLFLQKLKGLSLKTILVTNAHRRMLALKQSIIPLNNYLDEIYSSHDFGLPKEDPLFWEKLNDEFKYNPKKTILVDDNEDVLFSAKKYGIKYLVLPLKPDSQRPLQKIKNPESYSIVTSLQELL